MKKEIPLAALADAVAGANDRDAALLTLLRALQKGTPADAADPDGPASELKAALTNLIIMRARLLERQADLPRLLREAAASGAASVTLPDEAAALLDQD